MLMPLFVSMMAPQIPVQKSLKHVEQLFTGTELTVDMAVPCRVYFKKQKQWQIACVLANRATIIGRAQDQ
jgi:hypothetical protein